MLNVVFVIKLFYLVIKCCDGGADCAKPALCSATDKIILINNPDFTY